MEQNDDKIVSIAGGKVGKMTPQGAPMPELVEMLEELLERARRGEIVGVFFGSHSLKGGVGSVDFGWSYAGGQQYAVYAAAQMGTARFGQFLMGDLTLEP